MELLEVEYRQSLYSIHARIKGLDKGDLQDI
jgi:hypothetical protein